MILFELRCSQGHVFEAWFRDNATYDEQAQAGAITCVICGDGKVGKALMAPALGRRAAFRGDPGQQDRDQRPGSPGTEPIEQPMPSEPAVRSRFDPEPTAAALRALRDVQNHIVKNFVHVGPRFAEEARKMHYGEADKRSIYGEATSAEAKELRDEGIEVGQIPWLPRHDG
jgi:hypothetical protein